MNIFQNSVLKKYLKTQDEKKIDKAYCQFSRYFHNTEIQQNIRNSKEEQFQEGFLRELFVKILGYTLNPQPNFNLTTELKNEKGAKKTDGAILKNGKALAVIELKGTNTKDLDKVNNQAFNYKNNHSDCIYVITSNFEKLRFFIHNAVAHLEFNLFTLTEEEFKILWLCLNAENLLGGVPAKIKQDSILVEENVTKQLYKDYSTFKHELWQNLCKNQADLDKLLLFKKTQKLLDRFLFVFFAEDAGLLPPNSIGTMVKRYEQLIELDAQKALYDIFKQFFNYINTGQKGKTAQDDIFAYNGGLFVPDKLLDGLIIDDEVLKSHVLTMTAYNFESDIDVNILGHIFENSLSEIENVTAQLEGRKVDKRNTKRKKDGIFYTPKYITKYIVENTVGKLCEEKKTELSIVDKEYAKGRKHRRKKIVQTLYDNLQEYRNWLLEITICDPACGSGAFLNQALEFLIAEHAYIDELEAVLLGSSIIFQDVSDHVLEKNIFGVDINEESVDIAKLSLWLRTAQRGRKLTSLNNNIKCGNSLIDDPEVAGEKAFNWEKEFPQVFEKGGFDVVIGNPPYVQLQAMGKMSEVLKNCGFETYNKSADLYCLFYEKGSQLLRRKGYLGYITPNKWLRVNYGKELRKFLLTNVNPVILIDFPGIQVFADAVVDPLILILTKEIYCRKSEAYVVKKHTSDIETLFNKEKISVEFSFENWVVIPAKDSSKLEKMKQNSTKLKDLPISIYRGILTGFNNAFYINEETRKKLIEADANSEELIKPMVRGRDIVPYGISDFEYLISTFPTLKLEIENYPSIKKHLLSFCYDRLKQTGEKGSRKKTKGQWFETQDSIKYHEEFAKPKIIYPNMTSVFPFMYDESGVFGNDKSFILTANDKSVSLYFLTALFNSSLAKLWIWYNCPELGDNRREIRKVYFKNFPVPNINEEQKNSFEQLTKERIRLTSGLQTKTKRFIKRIETNLELTKLTSKLNNFYNYDFKTLLAELKKQKIKLSLIQQDEWEEYFNAYKTEINELQTQINQTDKEIDKMVCKLYELTPEEIEIVENSVK